MEDRRRLRAQDFSSSSSSAAVGSQRRIDGTFVPVRRARSLRAVSASRHISAWLLVARAAKAEEALGADPGLLLGRSSQRAVATRLDVAGNGRRVSSCTPLASWAFGSGARRASGLAVVAGVDKVDVTCVLVVVSSWAVEASWADHTRSVRTTLGTEIAWLSCACLR